MRLRRAGNLGVILAGFGQGTGVIPRLRAVPQQVREQHRRRLPIKPHRPFQRAQVIRQARGVMLHHLRPQMVRHIRQFLSRHK